MRVTLVTGPVYFPITLDEAKDHLNVDHANDDPVIQAMIAVATNQVEQFTRRRLITQTWKYFLDDWPNVDHFYIPFGQLNSVTHVKYTDSDGDQSTWDSSTEYLVDTDSDPGRVVLAYSKTYPGDTLYPSLPIEIQFVCGYGAHTPHSISGATNATPIVLTDTTHGYSSNDRVYVYGVGGNTNADGYWPIESVDANSYKLLESSGNAAYTSGGTVHKIDVPMNIINAIKLLLSDLYVNREETIINQGLTRTKVHAVESLLSSYRIRRNFL